MSCDGNRKSGNFSKKNRRVRDSDHAETFNLTGFSQGIGRVSEGLSAQSHIHDLELIDFEVVNCSYSFVGVQQRNFTRILRVDWLHQVQSRVIDLHALEWLA